MSPQNDCEPKGASLEINAVLELLTNPRCRAFIYATMDLDTDVIDLDQVIDVTKNAYWEIGLPPEGVTHERFYHNIIPRLQAKDVLDYDDRTGTIRYHGDPLLEKYARILSEDELG